MINQAKDKCQVMLDYTTNEFCNISFDLMF